MSCLLTYQVAFRLSTLDLAFPSYNFFYNIISATVKLLSYILYFLSMFRQEIADDAGLTAFSFGDEEVDRHVVIWKKV